MVNLKCRQNQNQTKPAHTFSFQVDSVYYNQKHASIIGHHLCDVLQIEKCNNIVHGPWVH